MSGATTASADNLDWTVTVTEPLPDCPSVEACWERLATQTRWGEWRSPSKLRGADVVTSIVPPATEPLKEGDEYVVKVGRFMKIRCRVLESSSPDTTAADGGEAVFDATGVALGGIVKARFRFTVFRGVDDVVMARAQEKIRSLPLSGIHPRRPSRVSTSTPSRTSTRASAPRERLGDSRRGLRLPGAGQQGPRSCSFGSRSDPQPGQSPMLRPPWRSLPPRAKAFRIAHVAWGVVALSALAHIWASAIVRRRDAPVWASVAFLLVQGVALVIGRGDCPFGPFQRRLGDPIPMFELVLPPRAAKAAIPVLFVVSVAGIAALVGRATHDGGSSAHTR